MRHELVDDVATLPGPHPAWCGRGHRCDAALGGLHRSVPEEWVMPVGRLTVWREGRQRGHLVVQWSVAITGDETALVARVRRALYAMQRVLRDGR